MMKRMITLGVVAVLMGMMAAGCSGADRATPGADDSEAGSNRSMASAPTQDPAIPVYAAALQGAVISPPRVLDDFTAPSTTGEDFTLSEHRGEVLVIYFGYRSCPDFCPTTFSELRRVYSELNEPADRVKILFVTVDPERDTMDMLTPYTQAFHDHFIGLRPEGEALQTLMDQFGVVAEKRSVGNSPLSYLIDHTATTFLIGPDGRVQAQYLYGTDHRVLTHDIGVILEST